MKPAAPVMMIIAYLLENARKYTFAALLFCISLQSGCNSKPQYVYKQTVSPFTVFGLSPALTEILFEICEPEQLTLVPTAADYPPQVKQRRAISTLPIDLESLSEERPSLILAEEGLHSTQTIASIRQEGYRLKTIRLESIEDLYQICDSIGFWTGNTERAQAVIARIKREIEPYHNRLYQKSLRIGVVFYSNPFMAYGPHNWMDTKLRFLGAKNAFESKQSQFVSLTLEELVQTPMSVMAFPSITDNNSHSLEVLKKYKPTLKIIHLNEDLATRPSTRLATQLADICKAVDVE